MSIECRRAVRCRLSGRRGRGVGFTSIEIVIKMIYKYPKTDNQISIDGTEGNACAY